MGQRKVGGAAAIKGPWLALSEPILSLATWIGLENTTRECEFDK